MLKGMPVWKAEITRGRDGFQSLVVYLLYLNLSVNIFSVRQEKKHLFSSHREESGLVGRRECRPSSGLEGQGDLHQGILAVLLTVLANAVVLFGRKLTFFPHVFSVCAENKK